MHHGAEFASKGVASNEPVMPLIPDNMAFRQRLGALPVTTYQAGERVLVAGSKTGRLLILKKGAVAIVKDNIDAGTAPRPRHSGIGFIEKPSLGRSAT